MNTNDTLITPEQLRSVVREVLFAQPARDMHTHLYAPTFGTPVAGGGEPTDPKGLLLWGIDELVTYHYLVAEVYRVIPVDKLPYERFWRLSKQQQADHIWKNLFVERTPISEACRGVLTTLQKLGLDPNERSLESYRRFFAAQKPSAYIDRVMELANVSSITMTNEVFDDNERNRWLSNPQIGRDPRFGAVLRIDALLRDYPSAARRISQWGYAAETSINQKSIEEAKRFLRDWVQRLKAIYIAVSLPPEFRYPADPSNSVAQSGQRMLTEVVLPVCAELGLPFAAMIGSEKGVNPALRDAGDIGRRRRSTSTSRILSRLISSARAAPPSPVRIQICEWFREAFLTECVPPRALFISLLAASRRDERPTARVRTNHDQIAKKHRWTRFAARRG